VSESCESGVPLSEFFSQLNVVVDLAVEDDGEAVARQRLLARTKVDDRQPLVGEPSGPSMRWPSSSGRDGQRRRHGLQHKRIHRSPIGIQYPDNPHIVCPLPSLRRLVSRASAGRHAFSTVCAPGVRSLQQRPCVLTHRNQREQLTEDRITRSKISILRCPAGHPWKERELRNLVPASRSSGWSRKLGSVPVSRHAAGQRQGRLS